MKGKKGQGFNFNVIAKSFPAILAIIGLVLILTGKEAFLGGLLIFVAVIIYFVPFVARLSG